MKPTERTGTEITRDYNELLSGILTLPEHGTPLCSRAQFSFAAPLCKVTTSRQSLVSFSSIPEELSDSAIAAYCKMRLA
jgi:hypothetical protein